MLTPEELLTTTRSVRRRLDLGRAVPRDLILECIDITTQAPTGSNRQQWQWLIVTDKDKRALSASATASPGAGMLPVLVRNTLQTTPETRNSRA